MNHNPLPTFPLYCPPQPWRKSHSRQEWPTIVTWPQIPPKGYNISLGKASSQQITSNKDLMGWNSWWVQPKVEGLPSFSQPSFIGQRPYTRHNRLRIQEAHHPYSDCLIALRFHAWSDKQEGQRKLALHSAQSTISKILPRGKRRPLKTERAPKLYPKELTLFEKEYEGKKKRSMRKLKPKDSISKKVEILVLSNFFFWC